MWGVLLGRLEEHIMVWHNTHSLCMCSQGVLFDLKKEKYAASLFYSKQDSAPLCPCHYLYLEVSTGDKFQLLSLRPNFTPPSSSSG